jgi:hypothetical protein
MGTVKIAGMDVMDTMGDLSINCPRLTPANATRQDFLHSRGRARSEPRAMDGPVRHGLGEWHKRDA